MTAIKKTISVVVITPEGEEIVNKLWACNARKAHRAYNTLETFVDKIDEQGNKTRVYCNPDPLVASFGWAEAMKPTVLELFEKEGCFHPENKSSGADVVDAICCDDISLIQFFHGRNESNTSTKWDGYFQFCRESQVRFIQ